jgi:hypothetical protein
VTILTDFKQLQSLADETPRDASDLHDNLREIYQALYLVDFSRYEAKEVRESAEELLRAIFQIRLDVRARIEDWRRKGLMTHPVQADLRDCFRASRYAGDMIGEIYLEHPRLAADQSTFAAFAGPWPNVMLNSALVSGPPTFEPGDVIPQRGMVHNSAAISRIGDTDSQFSHVGIVAHSGDFGQRFRGNPGR